MATTRTVNGNTETTLTTGTRRQIGACKCGKVHTRSIEFRRRTIRRVDTAKVIGTCESTSGEVDLACECGRLVPFKAIVGRVTETKCDARCTGSKGHVCNCSCGGANHGKGH
jgi:hypothetical protein